MSATWFHGMPKQRCGLLIIDSAGAFAPRGTDFMAAGAVFVSDADMNFVAAAGTLTNQRMPLAFDDVAFTVDAEITTWFNATAHGRETGDGPVRVSSSGTLPSGLSAATDYWIIKNTANRFELATSLANAYAGTNVTAVDAGTGTLSLVDTADTEQGIDGHFVYAPTEAETAAPTGRIRHEMIVMVDGVVDTLNFQRASGAGAYTTIGMAIRPAPCVTG